MAQILVTNDDGIDGPGLRVLVPTLVAAGHEVRVVAPDRDYSGAGGSLLSVSSGQPEFVLGEIGYEQRVLDEAPDVEAYALDGPPALCVMLTLRGAFGGPPDFVASGINFGLNVGPSVLHSGTVGAALTAASGGVQGLAISSEFAPDHPDELRYDTAAELAVMVIDAQIAAGHQAVSLNVPRAAMAELAGLRSAPLAPISRWRSTVDSWGDGVIKRSFQIGDEPVPGDSDSGLVRAGFATVTSLSPVGALDCSDLVTMVAEAAA